MTLFERISGEVAAQAKETGVPKKILQQVYDRGKEDAPNNDPTTQDACGKARVAGFVRGGVSREKDADLWRSYQSEDVSEAVGDLQELPNTESEVKSAGIFLPLPDTLARYFPHKEEDPSPPHVTLLYIGVLNMNDERRLVEVVREVANQWPPFRIDLALYSEFVNAKGQTIAHMVPAATICLSRRDNVYRGLGHLHADLYAALEAAGIDVQHNYGGEKFGTYDDRVATYKPHATLAYVSPGEKYTGHRPTGSWQITELEIWGNDKYRIPLGLHVDQSEPIAFDRPEDPEPDQVPTIDLRSEEEDLQSEVMPAQTGSPGPDLSADDLDEELASATRSAGPEENALLGVSELPSDSISQPTAMEEVARPIYPSVIAALQAVTPSVTPSRSEAAGNQAPVVAPVQNAKLQLEDSALRSEIAPRKETPDPRTAYASWNPVRAVESFGYLDGSVLIYGPGGDHDFAEFDPDADLTEDCLSYVQRRWDTVLCCELDGAEEPDRISTLLAARGLLRPGGQVLLALRQSSNLGEWKSLAGKLFRCERLPAKGFGLLRLRPAESFSEQEQIDEARTQHPPIQLPPINVGPVILQLPEREVQITAPIHVNMPELPAPQVNIAAGAIQVDVHTPPPVKKRVVMSKDPFGKITGELEVVEDRPTQTPEFPSMDEILRDQ